MTKHIETRAKLRDLGVASFNALLDTIPLSDTERSLMVLHYIKRQDFNFIADTLGFSESTIRRKHRDILKRIKTSV